MMRRLSGNKTLTPNCVIVTGADLVSRKNTARTVTSVFVVARFKIGHTRRKFPVTRTATSRFIAYLVQSRLIIIPKQKTKSKLFFKKNSLFLPRVPGLPLYILHEREPARMSARRIVKQQLSPPATFRQRHAAMGKQCESGLPGTFPPSPSWTPPSHRPGKTAWLPAESNPKATGGGWDEGLCSFVDEIYSIPSAVKRQPLSAKDCRTSFPVGQKSPPRLTYLPDPTGNREPGRKSLPGFFPCCFSKGTADTLFIFYWI